MRLMAGVATFLPDRRVFKDERTAQIAVAFHTARFIGARRRLMIRQRLPVRIVAVGTADRAIGQAVLIRALELRHGRRVALPAVVRFLSRGMHGVAIRTSDVAPGVSAADPSRMGRLIPMARQASLIGRQSGQLGRVLHVRRIYAFGVFPGAFVAGVAGGLHLRVPILRKRGDDLVVATAA